MLIGCLFAIMMSCFYVPVTHTSTTTYSRSEISETEYQMNIENIERIYISNISDSTLATGFYYVTTDGSGFERSIQTDFDDRVYTIDPRPILTVGEIVEMKLENFGRNGIQLGIRFGKEAAHVWQMATRKQIGKQIAIVVDNRLISAPTVQCEITGGKASISSGSERDLKDIMNAIRKEQKRSH